MQKTEILIDASLRELTVHGTFHFPFQHNHEDIRKFSVGRIISHWHKEFELFTVVSGNVSVQIGSRQIEVHTGEGMFLNTGIVHAIEAPEEGVISNILFSGNLISAENTTIYEKYIRNFFHSGISHAVLRRAIPWQRDILSLLEEIYQAGAPGKPERELDIHINICRIWKILYEHRDSLTTARQTGISIRTQVRLQQMYSYMEKHYAQKISLSDLAAAANISRSEATRCFRAGMGTTPMEALNEYRLSKAMAQIVSTAEPIMDIALENGFESSGYFSRVFKKRYGMSPRQARNR